MSLELLKERFGHSVSVPEKKADNREKIHERLGNFVSTPEKETDNKEKIHEKLNGEFNSSNGIADLKSFKSQHRDQIEEKQRIIENLEIETSELANEILSLKKDKAFLLEELNKSMWMENNVTVTAKKIYEDKLKTMSYVDSSKLIPLLVSVARKKQGNQKLNWGNWLKIPENRYLFQINQNIAKKIFDETNVLIDKNIRYINERRTYAGDELAKNYFLSFTGDTNSSTRKGDLVHTDFNPDDFDLNLGFTISYWVRPDELGADMFAIGRKAHNHARFTFGISRAHKGYFGVGQNQSERTWEAMFDEAGIDKATHLTYDTDSETWKLTIGKWYHFAVTYANRVNDDSGTLRKVYMNGQQIWGTGVSDPGNAGNINWDDTGREMSKGMSFGMRAVRGSGTTASYNNGWACGLDEVAIYDEEKDASWVSSVYDGGTDYDHSDVTKSDNDSTAKAAGTSQRGLVGYWKFNEGSGTTVEDLSGFGNHGLLTNDTYGDDGGAGWVDENDTPIWEER